jgi:hypothetical protein
MKRVTGAAGLVLATATLAAWPAIAEDSASFGARDPAGIRCALFTEMAEVAPGGTERQFYDWAQGYFAGRAAAGGSQRLAADGPERAIAYAALRDFCRQDPDADFGAAVATLWAQRNPAAAGD